MHSAQQDWGVDNRTVLPVLFILGIAASRAGLRLSLIAYMAEGDTFFVQLRENC